MRPAKLRTVLEGLFFKCGKEFLASDTGCKAWNVVTGWDPSRSRVIILQHHTVTPKSTKIDRCGEPARSGTHDDGVVDFSVFIHDVAPNPQMSESSPM